ncbi:MAG: hypothetical protein UV73_C0009G0047 [Candidatus Gottesmanbacteria bacterium GW2011_GWA2_43_14]|uniref:Uncharacterized protein n=1 Tax=Candidatus Gottesmanbacteria bacterium GW2011_GWA2_43_14 TaxID=1618443 RepID=A0A0G1FNX2_9BACT|nr:MAG: hypothetical protein UV73_C0009G0047 [Candidatus Gottesmanbacteria bacterium GW2011_GWA2_43_14]
MMKRSQDLGQTMIEVIVALTLIILFLSGVVIVELYAIRNADYSRHKSQATQLAKQQLERARVVRDAGGIAALDICQTTCFINYMLTPVPVTPTGPFGQSLTIVGASSYDCPLPEVTVIPEPQSYMATAVVEWGEGAQVTPVPRAELSSCITDWR